MDYKSEDECRKVIECVLYTPKSDSNYHFIAKLTETICDAFYYYHEMHMHTSKLTN